MYELILIATIFGSKNYLASLKLIGHYDFI